MVIVQKRLMIRISPLAASSVPPAGTRTVILEAGGRQTRNEGRL
jgi:hypothetical protein